MTVRGRWDQNRKIYVEYMGRKFEVELRARRRWRSVISEVLSHCGHPGPVENFEVWLGKERVPLDGVATRNETAVLLRPLPN